jgi:hypothetical protein
MLICGFIRVCRLPRACRDGHLDCMAHRNEDLALLSRLLLCWACDITQNIPCHQGTKFTFEAGYNDYDRGRTQR